MLGIIGGSGLNRLAELEAPQRVVMTTPFGAPSSALTVGMLHGTEVVFLARHGEGHTIAPHRINYRANIQALYAQGVRNIIAVATVGGIRNDLAPGTLLAPDQIIDYTHGREATFFDGVYQPLRHIDFTRPFHGAMRLRLLKAAVASGEVVQDGGVYGATQGPRLETAAEIDRMERDGADIVGMTGMPEAVLARELGLEYAMLCVVVNAAAGRGSNAEAVALAEITAVTEVAMRRVAIILDSVVKHYAG